MAGLVEDIQREAVDQSVPVATLLRKVKLAAAKLGLGKIEDWVEHELNGYSSGYDLPKYRRLQGRPVAFNPYQGWVPIIMGTREQNEALARSDAYMPLSALEDVIRRTDKGSYIEMPYDAETVRALNAGLDAELGRMANHLSVTQIQGVVDAVRDQILDWAIGLERAGIAGEGLSFNDVEKTRAKEASVTFNINSIGTFAGNMGTGNTSGDITVSASTSTQILEIVRKVRDVVPQLERDGVDGPRLSRAIDEIEHEAKKPAPDGGKLKGLLAGARDVLVGAAGNLTAEGAMALILEAIKSLS